MSLPSSWPLPAKGIRLILPKFVLAELARHPLSRDLYPRSFGFYPQAAGHQTSRSQHDDTLLLYCTDGCGQLAIDGQQLDVVAGDLVALPRGLAHAYQADSNSPWSLYFVHFDGPCAERFLTQADGTAMAPVTHLGVTPKLLADFEALLDARSNGYDLPTLVHAANHLRQMLAYLQALRPQQAEHGAMLERVHALMEQHLHEQLNLDTMAAAAGLSRFHFAKTYKQLTGEAPGQGFIHRKVQRACYLLDISDQPIRDIGLSLGYDDPYYFSRLFRQVIGLSPSAYRQARHG